MQRITYPPHPQQRGITLLETLIALIVSVLGILGILGMQMRTLVDTQTAVHRAQAIRLIEDLSERMRVNPNALASIASYESGFEDTPSASGCTGATGCSSADLITRDLGVWKTNVANALPGGQASVFPAAWGAGQVGIMVRWRENERSQDDSYLASLDAVTANGGTTIECNGDNDTMRYTCHMQYISVASRCARSTDGRNYCPRGQ